jgi:ferrous iron transport protein B
MVTEARILPRATPSRSTVLMGNPNVGKSVVFSALTGIYANVSNYSGTSVELASGTRRDGSGLVYDLPGTNNLLATSEDERVTRDFLLERLGEPGVDVLQVCDAKNLRRGLALTLQLAELEIPIVFGANMLDELSTRGLSLEIETLGELLGVPTFGTVATRREGLEPLIEATGASVPRMRVSYRPVIEEAVREIACQLPVALPGKRGVALVLLTGDRSLLDWASRLLGNKLELVQKIQADTARRVPESLRTSIDRSRLAYAGSIAARVLHSKAAHRRDWARRIGDLAMHPLWGWPIALVALYLVYLFVGVLGAGIAVDFIQNVVLHRHVTPWVNAALRWLFPGSVGAVLLGPPGVALGKGPGLLIGEYGVISMALSYAVAIVLPIVGFFFAAFSFLEDSGYLPRLAVMLNRLFRVVGLNGRAVLPLILGFGCDTMATMTTRILGTRKERVLVTLLLALGIPCSAQLGVILGMLSAISTRGALCWLTTVALVVVAVGHLASRLLPGSIGDFVVEVPPLRRPQLGNILLKTVGRIEWYTKEVVPMFMAGTILLWLLDRWAALGSIRRFAAPLVEGFLGLPAQATDAFLIGLLRRDYGAAGLYAAFHDQLATGKVSGLVEIQVIVAMVTITLFVPCIANVLVMIKERGFKAALTIVGFVLPMAFVFGGLVNRLLRAVML